MQTQGAFRNKGSRCSEKPKHSSQRVAPARHNESKAAGRSSKDPVQTKKKEMKFKKLVHHHDNNHGR